MFELKCCDNLELLRELDNNSIDLIYSDILFGTGKNFGDYQDLACDRSSVENFYYFRLAEMKRVLKTTGTIYLHVDYRINHWLRCLMDDIFGYDNFRNEIIWHYNSAPRKKGCFGSRHDTILRYTKSDIFTFNADEVREPYSLTAPRGYDKERYYNPLGKVSGDVWQINMLGQNDKTERVGYASQKPEALIDRIVRVSSNENDLVADFFAGSFTTASVCQKLNRQFIGCDINPQALEIGRKRCGL